MIAKLWSSVRNISGSALITAKSREGRRLGGDRNGNDSFIGGGWTNTIDAGTDSGFIGGGGFNHTSSSYAAIGGGKCNVIEAGADNSFAGGGYCNTIKTGSLCSAIGGGYKNNILGNNSFVGGGITNSVYNSCSSVVGGGLNTVSGAYSSVLGGTFNTVSGDYSSILGGSGNSDGGFNYAGVFGQGVTAVAPNTFHVECLNAVNTPNITTGPATGTVSYYLVTGAWPAGITAGMKVLVLA